MANAIEWDDERFEEGWLEENFDKLTDAEVVDFLPQLAEAVAESLRRLHGLRDGGATIGTETREALQVALVHMANVDW